MTTVGQAVFGYHRGHRLLNSSTRLPPSAMRVLREVSDARFSPGTERYVAVLPLPETHLIAAVSTWPAPDAPRLGSVWAHVLLIETAQLAKMPDLTVLLAAFQRPEVHTVTNYREPLQLPSTVQQLAVEWPPIEEVERVVSAVYSTDEAVTLGVRGPQRYEGLLFALWSQQWPALRRRFSFRTRAEAAGASADRFSVQLVERLPRELVHSADVSAPNEPWVGELADDLRGPHIQPKRFLWRFGSEAGALRTRVPAMYEVKRFIDATTDPAKVVAVISDRFPEPDQMAGLKQALLGPVSGSEPLWSVPEATRLRLVMTSTGSFDIDKLEVWPRLAALADQHSSALPEVIGALPGKLEGSAARALAPHADLHLALSLLDTSPGLAVKLFRQRPDLLAHPSVWSSTNGNRDAFVKIARKAAETDQIVVAALQAGDIPSACDLLSDDAVAVRSLNVLADKAVTQQLSRATAQEQLRAVDEALAWRRLNWPVASDAAVELVLDAFAPEGVVDRVSPPRLVTASRARGRDDLGWATALVLAALNEQDVQTARDLWLGGFGPVHRALADEHLSDELWAPLDRRLPERGTWDRCHRLRTALARHIKAHPWGQKDLGAAVTSAGPDGPRLYELLQSKKGKPWYEQVIDLFS